MTRAVLRAFGRDAALPPHPASSRQRRAIPALRGLAPRVALALLACGVASCIFDRPRPPVAPTPPPEPPVVYGPELPVHGPEAPPGLLDKGADAGQAVPTPKPPGFEGVDPETGELVAQQEERPDAEQPTAQEALPQEPAAEPAEPWTAPVETSEPGWLHGSVSMRYRGRFADGEQDQEALGVLALDMAHPDTPWIRGHLLARLDVDLDGLHESEIFEDLAETYDGSLVTKLYLAYADIELDQRPEDSPGTLRVGRQSDPRLPEVVRLDGLSYLTRPMGRRAVEVGVYGGIPAHLYESSREGDLAFGAFVEGRPWESGHARLDWMHLEDELVLGEERDDLLALALWQELSERWRLEGEFSHLEGDPRDLRLRTFFDDPESETVLRAAYYELLETQRQHVTELDPFFDDLLEYFPFRQATVDVSHGFGEVTVLDVGIDVRRVTDSDDVGEFNREWERYYATGTRSDLFTEGLALSVTADRWDDEDQDTTSLGADLSYDVDERWQAAIGTYYSLYKYQLLELSERDDVRTYYLRASRALSAQLDLDFLYEFEDDDLETYHTLRVGVLWQF